MAERDRVSINQFITLAVAEKVAALRTLSYIEQRGQQGSRESSPCAAQDCRGEPRALRGGSVAGKSWCWARMKVHGSRLMFQARRALESKPIRPRSADVVESPRCSTSSAAGRWNPSGYRASPSPGLPRPDPRPGEPCNLPLVPFGKAHRTDTCCDSD